MRSLRRLCFGIKMSFFAKFNARQQMGIAALIMGMSVLLSRFMGLFRDKVISWQFGAGGETDLYFAAFVLPDFLNYLLAGGYVSITLIPLLAKLMEEDRENAWRFFSAVFLWAGTVVAVLSLILWIFAPYIVPYLAPGFTEPQLARLTEFLRIILPAQVCFLPGACFTALLYIRRQFAVPALIPLIYNGMILLCGVALPHFGIAEGMEGFCWGVLLGAFLGSLYLPYCAAKSGGIVLYRVWKHPYLKRFLLLALPLMLGQSIVVLDEQFIRVFGSMAGTGEVSLLSYARRIMMVPVGVVAQAAGVASFPFLASLFAKKDMENFCLTLHKAIKNTLIIVIPLTAYLVAAAMPVLGLIFEGGRFGPEDTLAAAPYLQIMLLAVPFWCIQQILGRAFYAMENTKTPAAVGSVITVLLLPVYYVASPIFGGTAIAFLTAFSVFLYAIVMLFAGSKYFLSAYKGMFCLFLKNVLLVCIPFCVCYYAGEYAQFVLREKFSLLFVQFVHICVSGIFFVTVYFVMAKLFMPENIQLILAPFLRRLKK